MFNRSRESIKVNPSYIVSRKDYYERYVFPKNLAAFFEYESNEFIEPLIQFKGLLWGMLKHNIIRLLGNPRYSQEVSSGSYKYDVLFYKERLENIKTIVQLHFINECFFYACYTLKESNLKERCLVKTILFNKYGTLNEEAASTSRVYSDTELNKMIISDSVYLQIGYLSGNTEISDILNRFRAELEQNRIQIYREKEKRIQSLL